jgi:transcription regulator MmyB-like protein
MGVCRFPRRLLPPTRLATHRELFADWERMAAEVVAWLRMNAGRHLDDPRLSAVVSELSVKSEDFRRLWASHDVRHKPHGHKRFRHPLVGELALSFEIFPAPEDHELSVVVYSAEPGSPSADAVRLTASWGDRRQAGRPSPAADSGEVNPIDDVNEVHA